MDAALNTLMVATLAATFASALGTLAALVLHRYRFPGRKVLHGSIFVLTVSPDIVMGIAMLMFFIAAKIELGFLTLLIAHITLCLPFVAVTVLARLAEFDENIIEAAKDLGATESRAFRHIILPMIMPAVAAGWLLSFTLSMDDVLISFFVTGPTFEILPLKIYSMVRLGVKPDINALSAVMFTLTVVLVLAAHALTRTRRK
jgi:spermidine/putrescine transport system permease protein